FFEATIIQARRGLPTDERRFLSLSYWCASQSARLVHGLASILSRTPRLRPRVDKEPRMNRICAVAAPVLVWLALAPVASAQTTEFTYQGRLQDGANIASGNFD